MKKFNQITNELKTAKKVVITGHISPDADCVGSSLAMHCALQELGIESEVVFDEKIPDFLLFLPFVQNIKNKISDDADMLLIVDCAEHKRAGSRLAMEGKNLKTVVIDHHLVTQTEAKVFVIDSGEAACCQLIYDFYQENDLTITTEVATLLYSGILADTGRLTFDNTTEKTCNTVGKLLNYNINTEDVRFNLFEKLTLKGMQALSHVIDNIHQNDYITYSFITDEFKQAKNIVPDDYGNMVNYMLGLETAKVGILFDEFPVDGVVKINFRAKNGFNVAKVAQSFGGGGHIKAAGARVHGSLAEVIEAVIAEVLAIHK